MNSATNGMRFALAVASIAFALQVHGQSHDEHADYAEEREATDHSHHDQHAASDEPTMSERAHVPPEPPTNPLPPMSEERMIELMQMEDNAAFGKVLLERLEWREGEHAHSQDWDLQAFYGTDYNKLWIETEGARAKAQEVGRVEALWDRVISSWWSLQAGVRHDFSEGPSRTWAAVGLQGLAPYFFEVDAAIYVGEQGRTALRLEADYELLITQRLILQPSIELTAYGKDDVENGIGSGVSDLEIGFRLRYEIRREIAPYIGIQWERLFGDSADLARRTGDEVEEFSVLAGVRAWF